MSVLPESLLMVPLQTELVMNTHVTVSDIHVAVSEMRSDVAKIREGIDSQVGPVSEIPCVIQESGY